MIEKTVAEMTFSRRLKPEEREMSVRDLTMDVHRVCTDYKGGYFRFDNMPENENSIRYHVGEHNTIATVVTRVEGGEISTNIKFHTRVLHRLVENIADLYIDGLTNPN